MIKHDISCGEFFQVPVTHRVGEYSTVWMNVKAPTNSVATLIIKAKDAKGEKIDIEKTNIEIVNGKAVFPMTDIGLVDGNMITNIGLYNQCSISKQGDVTVTANSKGIGHRWEEASLQILDAPSQTFYMAHYNNHRYKSTKYHEIPEPGSLVMILLGLAILKYFKGKTV